MNHETYAAYTRIWGVDTRQMSPLGAVISLNVITACLSLNIKRALVSVVIRVAKENKVFELIFN
jgi:hypothetical protein